MGIKKKILNNKTINYIEAIVYICAIIICIFVCNSGPIYIKMLPILFLLGFVGRIIFDRPVVTTIFGIVTSLCIVKLLSNTDFWNNFFLSLCTGLNISLGELFGQYYIKSIKLYKKKEKINLKVILNTYFPTFFILIISILVHIYTNGNYISYFISRNTLFSYLSENYKDEKFKVVECKYTFYKAKTYTFEMKNITHNVNTNFIVSQNNDYGVYDEYKFIVQSQNNTKLNNEYFEYIKSVKTSLDTKIGYNDNGKIKLIISKNVDNINKTNIDLFVNETSEFLRSLKSFSKYKQIDYIEVLLIDNSNNKNTLISDFTKKDLENSSNYNEYIINSLSTEFID